MCVVAERTQLDMTMWHSQNIRQWKMLGTIKKKKQREYSTVEGETKYFHFQHLKYQWAKCAWNNFTLYCLRWCKYFSQHYYAWRFIWCENKTKCKLIFFFALWDILMKYLFLLLQKSFLNAKREKRKAY